VRTRAGDRDDIAAGQLRAPQRDGVVCLLRLLPILRMGSRAISMRWPLARRGMGWLSLWNVVCHRRSPSLGYHGASLRRFPIPLASRLASCQLRRAAARCNGPSTSGGLSHSIMGHSWALLQSLPDLHDRRAAAYGLQAAPAVPRPMAGMVAHGEICGWSNDVVGILNIGVLGGRNRRHAR
jgi:hypothetical protein